MGVVVKGCADFERIVGRGGKRTGRCEGRDYDGEEEEEKTHGCDVFESLGEVCWSSARRSVLVECSEKCVGRVEYEEIVVGDGEIFIRR